MVKQNYETAKKFYNLAIKLKDDRHEALNNLSCCLMIQGEYEEAIELLTKSKFACEKSKEKHLKMQHKSDKDYEHGLLSIYHNLFIAYSKLSDSLNSQKFFSLSLPLREQSRDRFVYVVTSNNFKVPFFFLCFIFFF